MTFKKISFKPRQTRAEEMTGYQVMEQISPWLKLNNPKVSEPYSPLNLNNKSEMETRVVVSILVKPRTKRELQLA